MDFFQIGPIPADHIQGYYDLPLVLLSYFVAVFASYVALSIAGSLRKARGDRMNFWRWLVSGAIVMGLGIWTMHFIGMEAFIIKMPMEYDKFLTLLSLIIAIIASGFALYLVARPKVSIYEILFGGVLMGIGIASMHYVGMAAMLHMHIRYIPHIFVISIIIAIVASQAALWLIIKTQDHSWMAKFNILSAAILGGAICGMHYVGMIAAVMTPDGSKPMMEGLAMHAGIPPVYIGIASSLIMMIFLALSTNNEKFLNTLERNNESLKAKEVELKEARDKAELANTAKSAFLANMSHEIRTPLNVIIGTASLLSRSDLSEKEKKYVDRIAVSSRILLNLIVDILDFSKIEAGELKMNAVSSDFISLVQDVVNMTASKAEEKNLKLEVKYDSQEPIKIVSDPIRLQQVITNLLANAIKFTDKGFVKIKILPKADNGEFQTIRLEIEDTGIGISEEMFGKIFQKFSQVDSSSTRRFGGTGLGLVISKELVRLLGGKIGFRSKLGKGSTFWFEIPFLKDKNPNLKNL